VPRADGIGRSEREIVRTKAGKAFLLLAIGVALAGFGAPAAQAAVVNVNPFLCQTFQGGSMTVPAGSEITIRQGVAEQTRGILTASLNAQTTTITVNGTTVDVSDAWPAPEQRPDGAWTSFITYPTGITLGAGDSLSVVWMTTLAHSRGVQPGRGWPARKACLQRGLGDIRLHGDGRLRRRKRGAAHPKVSAPRVWPTMRRRLVQPLTRPSCAELAPSALRAVDERLRRLVLVGSEVRPPAALGDGLNAPHSTHARRSP
jgi:hypothetical protein